MAEKENAVLAGTGDGNMSVGEAGASGEDVAAPEQGVLAEAKAVTGQEAVSEQGAAAETASPAAETAVRDEPGEETDGYDYEGSAGSDCSEEQTDASESSAWETVSECGPSGYAA